jgi:hypothetical protein
MSCKANLLADALGDTFLLTHRQIIERARRKNKTENMNVYGLAEVIGC